MMKVTFLASVLAIHNSNMAHFDTGTTMKTPVIDVRYRDRSVQSNLYVRFREPYNTHVYQYVYPYSYWYGRDYIPGFRYGGF
jgi:hypothetical protein